MARFSITKDLEAMVEFEGVGIRMPRARQRKVPSKLRRFAGEAAPEQVWRLRDITLSVQPGQAVAILGRRNSGREALLRLAAGTLIPDEGRVRRQAKIVPMIDVAAAMARNMTVRQNIYVIGGLLGLTPKTMGELIPKIAQLAGLQGQLERSLAPLSNRQINRLAWSIGVLTGERAFAIDKTHIGEDPDFAATVKERMTQMRADGVTFIVSADTPEVFLDDWDRAIVLEGGSILADTSLAEATVLFDSLGGPDDDERDDDMRIEESFEERDDLSEDELWEEPDDETRPRKKPAE
jgi:ABC-2 type transport system ATP-binding protein